ncbi:MAG TPA: hypothetical protein DD473_25680 [Planctomycetaceae bacterium]|nr:hypothetical protein [Planctomycetaceae bacterium]
MGIIQRVRGAQIALLSEWTKFTRGFQFDNGNFPKASCSYAAPKESFGANLKNTVKHKNQ